MGDEQNVMGTDDVLRIDKTEFTEVRKGCLRDLAHAGHERRVEDFKALEPLCRTVKADERIYQVVDCFLDGRKRGQAGKLW